MSRSLALASAASVLMMAVYALCGEPPARLALPGGSGAAVIRAALPPAPALIPGWPVPLR